MNIFEKIWNRMFWFFKHGIKYIFSNSKIRAYANSSINISKGVSIRNSTIFVSKGSSLFIGESCEIENVFMVVKGTVIIGKQNIIDSGYDLKKTMIRVDGKMTIGTHNRIRSSILIRYGGILRVGNYSNINEESEIRVDEKVEIGSYNQISYKVIIWDTNTHNIYSALDRRELTKNKYPNYGYEYEKPKTKSVKIGDDCWIGREAAIMKGTILGNKCIVGFRTVIIGENIDDNTTVITERKNKLIKNSI